jgi:mannan endo-1,4-beta-mannosidase
VRSVSVVAALIAVNAVVGCGAVANYHMVATAPVSAPVSCALAHRVAGGRHYQQAGIYIGVTVAGFPKYTSSLTKFENATGVRPGLISYDPRFGAPFDMRAACYAVTHGAMPVIQINPVTTPLAGIVDGKYDSYLRSYATEVRKFRARIVVSFGHEMNATWYRWGLTHTRSRLFVAAWRHIVDVFRAAGAHNVTWLWIVSGLGSPHVTSPRPWWPGGDYVNWVGIDAYYHQPSQTFSTVVSPTLAALRRFTHKPVLLADTGASPAAGEAAKIANLFAGIRRYRLLGLVWFDANKVPSWRLEANPAAVAAFRREINKHLRARELRSR